MTYSHRIIEDWMQVRQILSRPLPAFYRGSRKPASEQPASPAWDLNCGWRNAYLMANDIGWPEGTAIVKALSDKYINNLSHLEYLPQYVYDVQGAAFDIGLLMQGEPEHWIRKEDSNDIVKKHGKLYNAVINVTASHTVPADYIIRRGAATASIVSLIEYAGLSCELVATFATRGNKNSELRQRLDIRLKRHGEPLDIDRLALISVHPAGLRRLFVRMTELLSTDAEKIGVPYYITRKSYGIPMDIDDLTGIDVYSPAIISRKSTPLVTPFSCDTRTEAWIKEELVKLGVANA